MKFTQVEWRVRHKWRLLKQVIAANNLFERADALIMFLPGKYYRDDFTWHGERETWEWRGLCVKVYRSQALDYRTAEICIGRLVWERKEGNNV